MDNDNLIYLELEEIIDLHNALIEEFGGIKGDINIGQLDSVLQHIKNNKFYPTIIEKAVHLFFGICKFHCFSDGNKRTAIAATDKFLFTNDVKIPNFAEKMEDVVVDLAKGDLEKDDLLQIFKLIF